MGNRVVTGQRVKEERPEGGPAKLMASALVDRVRGAIYGLLIGKW